MYDVYLYIYIYIFFIYIEVCVMMMMYFNVQFPHFCQWMLAFQEEAVMTSSISSCHGQALPPMWLKTSSIVAPVKKIPRWKGSWRSSMRDIHKNLAISKWGLSKQQTSAGWPVEDLVVCVEVKQKSSFFLWAVGNYHGPILRIPLHSTIR